MNFFTPSKNKLKNIFLFSLSLIFFLYKISSKLNAGEIKKEEGGEVYGIYPDLFLMKMESFEKNKEQKILGKNKDQKGISSQELQTSSTIVYQCSHNIINDNCTNPSKIECSWDITKKVFWTTINVTNTSTIKIWTDNLQCDPDYEQQYTYCCPDTVVYLVRNSDNVVVGRDDDGNNANYPLSSKLEYPNPQIGTYTVIVTSYYTNRAGIGDIYIEYNGNLPSSYLGRTFGGHHIRAKEVRVDDVLLVGKNNNNKGYPNEPEYHDTTIFYFTTSINWGNCIGNCGKMLMNDDAWGMYLSRIDINYASTSSRIIAGVYRNDRYVNTRTFHIRRYKRVGEGGNWEGEAQKDNDGDGLTYEIEQSLGTCDKLDGSGPGTSVGIEGMDCLTFSQFVRNIVSQSYDCSISSSWKCNDINNPNKPPFVCWHACDSDNDGIRDDIEVWGVKTGCEKTPQPPYYDPGKCVQIPLIGPSFGNKFYSLPVSALDNPNPRIPDAYVENDYLYFNDTNESLGLKPSQILHIKKIYSERGRLCWDGTQPNPNPPDCPPNCFPHCANSPNDRPYEIRIHIYQDKITFPYITVDVGISSDMRLISLFNRVHFTFSYYNHSFTQNRKYTNIFRYSMPRYSPGGGEAEFAGGRTFIYLGPRAESLLYPNIFSHEHGHLLNLSDAKFEPRYPAYPSIMNYGYGYFLPPMQDGFGTCSSDNKRFSKGLNNLIYGSYAVDEYDFSEVYLTSSWLNKKLAYEVNCYRSENNEVFYQVDSYPDYNCIDWNENNELCESSPISYDINHNGVIDKLKDKNDWELMISWAKKSFTTSLYRNSFAVYQDGFNNSSIFNFSGWSFPIYSSAVYEDAIYRINHCSSSSDCHNQMSCKKDFCSTDAECKIGCLINKGICRCAIDDDCYSGSCDQTSGICQTEKGTCTCSTNNLCWTEGCSAEGICINQKNFYKKAIKFRGSGNNDYLRLSSSQSGPIDVLHNSNFFYNIDFKWDGWEGAQTEQVILESGHLGIYIVKTPSGDALQYKLPGSSNILVYPYRETGKPIRKNRWFRIQVGFKKPNILYAYVYREKEIQYGLYPIDADYNFIPEGCVYKEMSGFSLYDADIVFAYSSDDNKKYKGSLDNINIFKDILLKPLDYTFCIKEE